MIKTLFSYINQPLPIGIILIIGILVLNYRVQDIIKRVDRLNDQFDDRFKWCLEHFEAKDKPSKADS